VTVKDACHERLDFFGGPFPEVLNMRSWEGADFDECDVLECPVVLNHDAALFVFLEGHYLGADGGPSARLEILPGLIVSDLVDDVSIAIGHLEAERLTHHVLAAVITERSTSPDARGPDERGLHDGWKGFG
jgi:hypothetical protein